MRTIYVVQSKLKPQIWVNFLLWIIYNINRSPRSNNRRSTTLLYAFKYLHFFERMNHNLCVILTIFRIYDFYDFQMEKNHLFCES